MRVITVTTIVETTFQIPGELSIETIRHQALPDIADDEECSEPIVRLHEQAINQVFMGDAVCHKLSVKNRIAEVE